LLPIGSGFLIAHQEVLIVDARKMERERYTVYLAA
jgi:hypothetical protein